MSNKSYKYIEYLLTRRSFPDFLKAVNFKVDLKEWSETVGMLNQVMDVTEGINIDHVFDVGCGKRPTLGILIALGVRSLNNIICIDPQLDVSLAKEIKGITLKAEKLEDYLKSLNSPKFGNCLICCNHSHVPLREIRTLLTLCEEWTYITNPCCVDNKLLGVEGRYFRDKHIWSPKNEIYIFHGGG